MEMKNKIKVDRMDALELEVAAFKKFHTKLIKKLEDDVLDLKEQIEKARLEKMKTDIIKLSTRIHFQRNTLEEIFEEIKYLKENNSDLNVYSTILKIVKRKLNVYSTILKEKFFEKP